MQRKLLAFCFCFALAACGGTDDSDGSGDSRRDGGPSSNGGASRGSGPSCSSADDCSNHACQCRDGAVVNARTCYNGTCLEASSVCPEACMDLGHGGWSSNQGGSKSSGSQGGAGAACYDSAECSYVSCTCRSGFTASARGCTNGRCDSEAVICPWACEDEGGW